MGIFVHVPPDNQILDPTKLEVKRDRHQRQHKRLKKVYLMFETLGYQTCSPGFLRSQFIVVISSPTHSFPTIRPKLLKTELMPESTLLSQHVTSWEKRKNRACSPGVSRALIAQSVVRRRPGGFVRRWLGRWLQLCAGAKTKTQPATRLWSEVQFS